MLLDPVENGILACHMAKLYNCHQLSVGGKSSKRTRVLCVLGVPVQYIRHIGPCGQLGPLPLARALGPACP